MENLKEGHFFQKLPYSNTWMFHEDVVYFTKKIKTSVHMGALDKK